MTTMRGTFDSVRVYETTQGRHAIAYFKRFDDGSGDTVSVRARGPIIEALLWLRPGQPIEIFVRGDVPPFEGLAVTTRSRSAMLRPFREGARS